MIQQKHAAKSTVQALPCYQRRLPKIVSMNTYSPPLNCNAGPAHLVNFDETFRESAN